MDAILRRAVRRVFLRLPGNEALARVYRNLYRFLLGNDVFVSYGRRDGTRYPEALVRRLVREGLVCYYDRLGAPPGATVSARVLSQARNSSMLVVVAGPAAAASDNVGKEIAAFGPEDRSVIPIDCGGSLQQACWLDLIPGITEEPEPLSALDQGEVSDAVVQRIVGAEDFVSRDRRLRQVFKCAAGAVAAIVLAATLYSSLRVRGAEERRTASELEQRWAQMGAELERWRAGQARSERETALNDARRARDEASAARDARDSALHAAGRARGEASRQQAISEAIRLANRAEVLRNGDLDSLPESIRLAAESLRRFGELNTTYLNADRTLRKAIELVRPVRAKIRSPARAPAEGMAFSPDGQLVALYGRGIEGIEVWSLAGEPHKAGSLPDPAAASFRDMAFHQGRLALAAKNGSLWICGGWETPDPRCQKLGSYDGHVAAFMDGRFVAIDSAKAIQIWNLADEKPAPLRVILKDLPGEVTGHLALAGHLLAVVSSPRWGTETVHVFDVESGSEKARFPSVENTPGASTRAVALSADGHFLAAAISGRGADGIAIWDLPGRSELARLPMPEEVLQDLAFSPDGWTLATGGRSRVRLWDLSILKETARLPGAAGDVAFSADGSSLAAFFFLTTFAVRVWDLKQSPDAPLQTPAASGGLLSRNGRYLAARTSDRVEVFEVQTGTRVLDQSLSGMNLAFSPAGTYLVGGIGDEAWMLEIPTGRRIPIPALFNYSVSFDDQERFFAVLGRDRIEIRRTGEEHARVRIPMTYHPLAQEMSPRGRYLAVAGPDRDRSLEVWSLDLGRGRARRTARVPLPGMLYYLAWSPDERHLAAAFDEGLLLIGNDGSRPVIARLPPVAGFRFDPGGERFVAALRDGTQWVCDLRGACPSWVSSYSSKPVHLALDPAGRYAAAALGDHTTEVWDLTTRRRVAHFEHERQEVNDLAFTAGGRILVSVHGSQARRWLWRPEDLIQEAWRRLGEAPATSPSQ